MSSDLKIQQTRIKPHGSNQFQLAIQKVCIGLCLNDFICPKIKYKAIDELKFEKFGIYFVSIHFLLGWFTVVHTNATSAAHNRFRIIVASTASSWSHLLLWWQVKARSRRTVTGPVLFFEAQTQNRFQAVTVTCSSENYSIT